MFTPQLALIALAVITGMVYLPNIFAPKKFRKATKTFIADPIYIRISSFFLLILSLMFLSVHWKLSGGFIMTISLIGWLLFIKGLVWFWNPEFVQRMMKQYLLKNEALSIGLSILTLAVAAILLYLAFAYIELGEFVVE